MTQQTIALVGYTGFVGSNLYSKGEFTAVYNSRNIADAYDTNPDILYYAGVRAEKFLANKDPQKDKAVVEEALDNIKKINPKKLVLISTIDVYKNPIEVDEDTPIDTENLHPYGYNRYLLEQWVREEYPEALIVRLPGLFGPNIKKNFIYDYIHLIPSMLNEAKFTELENKCKTVDLADYAVFHQAYVKQDNGFYKFIPCENQGERKIQERRLKEIFTKLEFSALQFTDSRGIFQFYDLQELYGHIQIALKHDIRLLNIATQPVSVGETYRFLATKIFKNEIVQNPPKYDMHTKYDTVFGGKNGYLQGKIDVLNKIEAFVKEELKK